MYINESEFLRYKQCPKLLWLSKSSQKSFVDVDQEWVVTEAYEEIIQFARMLFPDGVLVNHAREKIKMLQETEKFLLTGARTIFQAVFEHEGAIATIDILHRTEEGWFVYAISPTTSLKDRMRDRITFQIHVVSKVLDIKRGYGITLNNQYVRQGELKLDKLFNFEEASEFSLVAQPSVSAVLAEIRKLNHADVINCDIGKHCNKYKGDECECPAKTNCWSHIPEYSVFNISRISDKAFDLYRQGIVSVADIPDHFSLTRVQAEEVRVYKEKTRLLDKQAIADFISAVQYPVYFLDLETFQMRIPQYDGIRPYQQIPFQYSLHILEYPGAPLMHKEFLAVHGTDPRTAFAESLTRAIPKSARVFVYSHYESTVLKLLIRQVPAYADSLQEIIDNFVDLITLFRVKAYLTPEMKGRSSIKYILPALFPDETELDYQRLKIKNGVMAMTVFERLQYCTPSEVLGIRQDLLNYCRLDTLAMVRIWADKSFALPYFRTSASFRRY